MLTCKEVADFMMGYLSGELPPPTVQLFEAHLKACPNCVTYLANYKTTVELGRRAYDDECEDAIEGGVPEDLVQAIVAARYGREQ